MSGVIDGSRLRDPQLRPIAEKVTAGERLTPDEGVALYATTDLLGLGLAGGLRQPPAQRRPGLLRRQPAHQSDQRLHPAEHLRVLLLRADAEGGWRVHPLAGGGVRRGRAGARHADAGVPHRRRAASQAPAELLHGHDPRAQGAPPAGAHQGADGGRDRAPRADREDPPSATCCSRCKEAGLTSLPGGGAEVFSTAVRATIAERKLTGEEWIRVHRVAHELGIPTNCTMLYGHVETAEDRIEHLSHAARAPGRDRRVPHLHPAGLSPRPQRAGRGAGTRGHGDDRLRGPQEHRRRRGSSSTTSRT